VRNIGVWGLLALFSSVVLLGVLVVPASATDLAFFEASETRGQGHRDTATLPSGTKIYIARAPSLVIAKDEIETVEVSQRPIYADSQSSIDHELRERFGKSVGREPSSRPIGHHHVITFTLRAGASKQFNDFASRNVRGKFALRLDNRDVGYVFLLGPSDGNLFSVPVPDRDESSLRGLLSPLASKVVWKTQSGSD